MDVQWPQSAPKAPVGCVTDRPRWKCDKLRTVIHDTVRLLRLIVHESMSHASGLGLLA